MAMEFRRRKYTVEGADLDTAKRIELIVRVNGIDTVRVQAREPGMLSFVSRPNEQGFDIDIVEVASGNYTDVMQPELSGEGLAQWQLDALGVGHG